MIEAPRAIAAVAPPSLVRFTIATLVTDRQQYDAMTATLRAGGFAGLDCEYLYLDNSAGNGLCATRGLNRLLEEARGDLVILCHQDVRLIRDGRAELEARLGELQRHDPAWALAGNAGGAGVGRLALRITDGHGTDRHVGSLPERVASLDENFIVVRRAARLAFSADLEGFHFYGADICLAADTLGWSSYVIDFHLQHLSKGVKSEAFHACERAFRAKWSRALRPRWIQTTCSLLYLSGSELGRRAGSAGTGLFRRLSRRLPGARGWKREPASSKA